MSLFADTEASFVERFAKTDHAVRSGIKTGLHRGCQVYVSHQGEPVANVGLGEAADGVTMTAQALNLWRSSGKPMTAAAVLRVLEQTGAGVDELVRTHIPEFADESIRIIDLLTHTSGLPNTDVGWPNATWDEIVTSICGMNRDPSVAAAYSYFATWFLLGEILRRRDCEGRSFADLMRATVFEPLDMLNTWNGMSAETWSQLSNRIAEVETITLSGRRRTELLHEEAFCTQASPGANLRSTARDVGRFFEALHGGEYFASPETLSQMVHPHRVDLVDATFKAKVRMGLGVVLASDDPTVPYGFGDHCSPQTYGHGGAQCAMAFCDPAHELVVAWAVNGFPGEPKHQHRNRAINSAIYEDLGLAS
ncbi:MAG: serine hydrolase domain-containing protein [Planctomycetaceae bacterium]